jgi:hypothetical protein
VIELLDPFAERELEPALREMIYGCGCLGEDGRMAKDCVRDQRSDAYPPRFVGDRSERRPAIKPRE